MAISNFFMRSITALILGPLVIAVFYLGGYYYNTLMLLATITMAYEWNYITSSKETAHKNQWYILGLIYICLPIISLIWLRNLHDGLYIILWLFAVVWSTDIGAYIFGRLIGGWKLAPSISPNKTWSGLAGGMICAGIAGFIYAYLRELESFYIITAFSILLAIYAQIGDLLESCIKRYFGVKDSGNIIPGHGGILDRVDGLILTAPKIALIVLIQHGKVFW